MAVALHLTIPPAAPLHDGKARPQRFYCIMAIALQLTILQRLFAYWPFLVNSRLSQRLYYIRTVGSHLMTVPTVLFFAVRFSSLLSNDSVA